MLRVRGLSAGYLDKPAFVDLDFESSGGFTVSGFTVHLERILTLMIEHLTLNQLRQQPRYTV